MLSRVTAENVGDVFRHIVDRRRPLAESFFPRVIELAGANG